MAKQTGIVPTTEPGFPWDAGNELTAVALNNKFYQIDAQISAITGGSITGITKLTSVELAEGYKTTSLRATGNAWSSQFSDGAADERNADIFFSPGKVNYRLVNSDYTAFNTYMEVVRSGYTATNLNLTANNITLTGNVTLPSFSKFTSTELAEGFATTSNSTGGNAWASKFRDGPVDGKNADVFFADTHISYRLVNDAYNAYNTYLEVVRSGYTATNLNINATAIGLNGVVTFNNQPSIPGYLTATTASSTYLSQVNAASAYAPLASPTFTGTVTIPAGASITGYLTSAIAGATYAPLANPTFTGTVQGVIGSFSGGVATHGLTTDLALNVNGTTGNCNIELGALSSTSTPNLDFLSSGAGLGKQDVRLQATGGSTSTLNQGTLNIQAAGLQWNGAGLATQSYVTGLGYLTTATASTTYLTQAAAGTTYLTQTNASTTYAPKANPTFTGTLQGAIGSFSGGVATHGLTTDLALNVNGTTGNCNIELGPTGSTGTPNLDFLSSGAGLGKQDVRLQATGGSTSVLNQGTLNILAGTLQWNSNTIATQAYVTGLGYLTTAAASTTYAPLASPTFTGTPTVPGYLTTAIAASTYAPIANPTFTGTLQGAIGSFSGGVATHGLTTDLALNVNGTTGNCNIELGPTSSTATPNLDFLSSGAGLGKQDVRLQATGGNTSVLNQGTLNILSGALQWNGNAIATQSYVTGLGYLTTAAASTTYAPIASPTFTGTVTIPAGASISGYLTTATAASTYAPLANPTFTGTIQGAIGSFSGGVATHGLTTDLALNVNGTTGNCNIEIGPTTVSTTATPNIDFLTSGAGLGLQDVRIQASGGSTGTRNQGTLNILAGALQFNSAAIATQSYVTGLGYLTTATASTTYLTQTAAGTTYLTQANATSTYAPKASPTFTGTVTIPTGASIAGYLTTATASSTYAPLANPTFTGTLQGNIGSFSGGVATHGLTTDLALNVNGTTGNCNIELGPVTGATATPNLDFLSSGAGLGKQDVRLQATGGNTSVLNQGTLNILAAALQWNSNAIATQSYVTGLGYLTTATAASTYATIDNPTFTGTVTIPSLTTINQPVFGNGFHTTSTSATGNAFASFFSTGNVDEKNADIFFAGTNVSYRFVNDGYTAFSTYMQATRSGYTTTNLQFTATNIGFTGTVTIPAGASISGYLTTASATSTYAPLASPTFTGTVTIPAGASISGYLTTATASSTYLSQGNASVTYAPKASPTFTGTVTIPTGAAISGYLTTANAASTYAPLASPTFTGTVTIPSLTTINQPVFGNGFHTTSTSATGNAFASFFSTGNADEKNSDIFFQGTNISYRFVNDAYTAFSTYMQATRSGYTTTNLQFTATAIGFTGTVTIPAGASISGYLTTANAASTYAPLASPTFTGTVTIPTGASIAGYLTAATAASTYATIDNPTFTGTVTIPSLTTINQPVFGNGFHTTSTSATGNAFASFFNTGNADEKNADIFFQGTNISYRFVNDAYTAFSTYMQATRSGYTTTNLQFTATNIGFTGTVTIPAGASISGYLTTASATSTYAPLASPTFTGTVTIPAGASISGYLTTATASSTYLSQGNASVTYATKASPTFTGTVTLPTGTTTAAPLKFVAGSVLTTPVAGTVEWDGTNLYATQTGPTRQTFAYLNSPTFTGTPTVPGYLTTATAASTYAPLASPTFTGTVTIPSLTTINQPVFGNGFHTTSTSATGNAFASFFTTGNVDEKNSDIFFAGTNVSYRFVNDAYTAFSTYMQATRSGYTTTNLQFTATAIGFTGTVTIPSGASIAGYLTTAAASTTYAPIASPTFTGTVTIPTGASIAGYLTTASAASIYAPLASPTFTGTPVVPGYLTTSSAASTYAPIASPTFTGTVTIPSLTTINQPVFGNGFHTTSTSATGNAFASFFTTGNVDEKNSDIFFAGTNISYRFVNDAYTAFSTYMQATRSGYTTTNLQFTATNIGFTGTVTIPAGASISGYLTTSTAASTYLTSATAASTYAPIANPTFTGTVTIPSLTTINQPVFGNGFHTTSTSAAGNAFASFFSTGNADEKNADIFFAGTNISYRFVNDAYTNFSTYMQATRSGFTTTNLQFAATAIGFTGTVTLPSTTVATTQTAGDNTTAPATTAFVYNAKSSIASLSTTGGSTTLTAAQYGASTLTFTGALTSNATIVVPTIGNWLVINNTTGAFTLTVKTSAGTGVVPPNLIAVKLIANGTNVVAAYTPIATTTTLGVVKVGSGLAVAADGTISATGTAGVTTFNTRSGTVTLSSADVTSALTYTPANNASPTFTGTVTIPSGASISGYLTTASASSTYATIASPSFSGTANAANVAISGQLSTSGGAIEHGTTASATTPYMDWHSSGTASDYDVRMIASGGSSTVGQGTLNMQAAHLQWNGVDLAPGTALDWYRLSSQSAAGQFVFALPAGYARYKIVLENTSPTVNASLYFRVSFDGGSTYVSGATDYSFAQAIQDTAATTVVINSGYCPITSSDTTGNVTGTLELQANGAKEFQARFMAFRSGVGPSIQTTYGFIATGTTITHILIGFASTTVVSGTARLYGMQV